MSGSFFRFLVVLAVFAAAAFCGPAPALAKEQTVYHVPPNKIASYIAKKKGRKRAIIVWASWCPACRNKMYDYTNAERLFPGSMILISVDDNLEQLRNYLDKTDLTPIKTLIVQRTPGQSLDKALSRLGAKPIKSYPTAILLDENNKVVQQGSGTTLDILTHVRFVKPADKPPELTESQKNALLKQYPVFSDYLHVIAANDQNGLHAFLDKHIGRTVFIDAPILRYGVIPKGFSAADRDKIPPTDRFENPVIQRCWTEEMNQTSELESGSDGLPLPRDLEDIVKGCAFRIRFDLEGGNHSSSLNTMTGGDKHEILVAGFFAITKESLNDGKTLYILKEVEVPMQTLETFHKGMRKEHGQRI